MCIWGGDGTIIVILAPSMLINFTFFARLADTNKEREIPTFQMLPSFHSLATNNIIDDDDSQS